MDIGAIISKLLNSVNPETIRQIKEDIERVPGLYSPLKWQSEFPEETDTAKIRKISEIFLRQPLRPYQALELPAVLDHPIFNSGVMCDKDGKLINLLDETSFKAYCDEYHNKILMRVKFEEIILIRVREPYKTIFFKYCAPYLSKKDFATGLQAAWVDGEGTNYNPGYTIEELLSWFKRADKPLLMDKKEYKKYIGLPETVQLYRGMGRHHNLGISWTSSKEKAEWFAKRYSQQGYLANIVVPRSCILAFFERENEYIVDIASPDIDIKNLREKIIYK